MKTGMAVSLLTLVLFLGACDKTTYYSQTYCLPQSQSAEELAKYLASEHLDYQLDGWFFFGSLIDSALPNTPENAGSFAISMQRIRTPKADGLGCEQIVLAAIAFNSPTLGRYIYGGAQLQLQDVASSVSVTSDPWRVEVYDASQQTQPLIAMSLCSGTMGAPGAVYRLTGDALDNLGGRFQADVLVRDRLGAVNQGYGTTSFFPQFLTDCQRHRISESFGNSVDAYLQATGDPMRGQGSYYYSTPLMDVQEFTITRDGAAISSGDSGAIWMDAVVQTYDLQAMQVLINDSSWKFFSIMFPEENAAIMAIQITSGTGVLEIAKMFNTDGSQTRNSALNAAYTWTAVDIEEAPGSATFTSPDSGHVYNLEYRLTLGPDNPADFNITMIRPNQEMLPPDGRSIYEGLGSVRGTLGGKTVTGTAFTELESVSAP